EPFELPEETVRAVAAARARGGRIVAVGTTSARVLESRARDDGPLQPGAGETQLLIAPGTRFRAGDAVLTDLHLPRSSLLLRVAAGMRRARAHPRRLRRGGARGVPLLLLRRRDADPLEMRGGFAFELGASDGGARRGRLRTPHGAVDTPAFMPVATYGAVRGI